MKDSHKLIISILLDIIGICSYLLLGIGEFTDIIFAPIQFLWIFFAYKSTPKAIFGGLEEILPFTDIFPSCTVFHFINRRNQVRKKK